MTKRTPVWWNKWCWWYVLGIVWSLGWLIFGHDSFTRGFQAGMVMFWLAMLMAQYIKGSYQESLRLREEINDINSSIIDTQRRHIENLQDHINYLKEESS